MPMDVSRRALMRRMGLTAVAGAAIPPAHAFSVNVLSYDSSHSPGRGSGPIRLDMARNAGGPPARTLAAMRQSLDAAREYSDRDAADLRKSIAEHHGVHPDQVVVGCGSGEILRMAALAFTGAGRQLITGFPTCQLISHYARRAGAELRSVPLNGTYAHDLPAMAKCATDPRTGLIYVCNPNSPTGTLTRRQDIDLFLTTIPPAVYVLIDEAHHQYTAPTVETASFLARRVDDDRVIVVRSFSNIYGFPGVRVGDAVTAARTARLLEAHCLDRNLNVVAARAAAVALEDSAHVEQSVRRNADERQEFYNQVHARMLRVIDSQTNFVMLDTGREVSQVIDHFRQHDIVLAPPFRPFERHIRVSLGTEEEMREFWRVWDLMPGMAAHPM